MINNNDNKEDSKKENLDSNISSGNSVEKGKADDMKYASPDKYLALEQEGVTYTPEKSHVSNSEHLEFGNDETAAERWKAHHENSRNSDAFNQDDYILNDNIDLDEDQSQSISSEDDFDTNTTDEI